MRGEKIASALRRVFRETDRDLVWDKLARLTVGMVDVSQTHIPGPEDEDQRVSIHLETMSSAEVWVHEFAHAYCAIRWREETLEALEVYCEAVAIYAEACMLLGRQFDPELAYALLISGRRHIVPAETGST